MIMSTCFLGYGNSGGVGQSRGLQIAVGEVVIIIGVCITFCTQSRKSSCWKATVCSVIVRIAESCWPSSCVIYRKVEMECECE
jgi:hypothetical protein